MSFWDVVWFIVITFAFIAYLMVMFSIITDLFRDRDTGGVAKAVWIVCLIFLPLLTSLVYLITRGTGMAERSMRSAQAAQAIAESRIREMAGTASPADEIAKGKALLDAGVISEQDFAAIKRRALAGDAS